MSMENERKTPTAEPMYCDFGLGEAPTAKEYVVRDTASKRGKRVRLCEFHLTELATDGDLTIRPA